MSRVRLVAITITWALGVLGGCRKLYAATAVVERIGVGIGTTSGPLSDWVGNYGYRKEAWTLVGCS